MMKDLRKVEPEREQTEAEEAPPAPIIKESLERITTEEPEADLEPEQVYDTQHSDGHTYNPHLAADQGLTYTPPDDPPVISSEEDPQGAEIAAGFAPSMEDGGAEVRDLPVNVDQNDLDLRKEVYEMLRYNSETTHLQDVQVMVREGVVELDGTVTTPGDIALVYSVVSGLPGVLEVRSRLQVREA